MKTKKLVRVVEDGAQTAVEFLSPYAEQALREGGQLADQTYSRIRPVIKDAGIRGARLASDTFERVHPVLDDALDRVYPAVDATVKVVKPAVDDVLQRIPTTVDHARDKVQSEYLPQIADLLHELARQPLARELKVAAASAALARELDKVSKPKKSGWKVFGQVLLAGAVLGGVVVAVRKLLADPSTGWETHTPRSAYVADPVADVVADAKTKAAAAMGKVAEVVDDLKEKASDLLEGAKDKGADIVDDARDTAADAAKAASEAVEDATDQGADLVDDAKEAAGDASDDIEKRLDQLADEAEGGDASPLAVNPYGAGSYVGDEPPEGFSIKGNDRSMKYHIPGSAAYERTVAEVWFDSEEAALAAGFVRAQR